MKMLSRSIVFVLLVVFASCELPKLEPPTDCPNPPVPSFTVDKDACDIPCKIMAANTSTNTKGYGWYIDGELKSVSETPPLIEFSTQGDHKIELKGKNQNDCEKSFTQLIKVTNVTRFEKLYTLGTNDVFPLGASQLSNGNYHVLFRQSSDIKSILIDRLGIISTSAPKTISGSINIVGTSILANGEFLAVGTTGNPESARVIKITASQAVGSGPQQSLQFDGASSSIGAGVITTGSNETLVTGNRNLPSAMLGYARIDVDNRIVAKPTVIDPLTSSTTNYRGISIADAGSGKVYVLASSLSGAKARLFSLSLGGSFSNFFDVVDITTPKKIIALGGGKFAVIGTTNTSTCKLYYFNGTSFNPSVSLNFNEVHDIILHSNGKILICGTTGKNIQVASIVNGQTSPVIYATFSPPSASSKLTGISINETIDMGYLVLAQHINSSDKKELYLIKSF